MRASQMKSQLRTGEGACATSPITVCSPLVVEKAPPCWSVHVLSRRFAGMEISITRKPLDVEKISG